MAKPTQAGSHRTESAQRPIGCLVDTTVCIGCRRCEAACAAANDLPESEAPPQDQDVFSATRRPSPERFTVVNRVDGPPSLDQRDRPHTYAKIQCMHCQEPACVSACIVGALQRESNGAVTYDAGRCIGCRYCLVACPFQLPTYEYDEHIDPQVRKCLYCYDQHTRRDEAPACAAACPVEAIQFGPRDELLRIARDRLAARPDRYVDHIYGEHEVGGTSWLYLAGRDFGELGFQKLGSQPIPALTEAIQHGTFKFGLAPLALYATLAATAWATHRRDQASAELEEVESGNSTEERWSAGRV